MSLNGCEVGMRELNVSVHNGAKLSLEQVRAFLEASEEVRFEATSRPEVYGWITRTLCQQEYWRQERAGKGLLRLLSCAKLLSESRR